ncbi:MAG: type I 3-dehydroquinate dehydratase [Clostridium sp.]|nr:type I 3-dehydroquinate dehydratase [Clostridium sp.]MDU7083965.1 type I 3-dehydroquinate dehydratase [Clostridium sp.]
MKKIIEIGSLKIGEGVPKICVPIIGTTKEEIINSAKFINESGADFVEWRADFFNNVKQWEKVEEVLHELKFWLKDKPLLFTFRTLQEGGNLYISSKKYLELNINVIRSKTIDFVDIEYYIGKNIVRDLVTEAKINNVYTVISNHDFNKTPNKDEIINRLCEMQKLNGDMIKIAVMAKEKSDVFILMEATEEMARIHADRPIIAMSMSAVGMISRVAGEFFGSDVTFATVGEQSAPGQLPIEKVKKLLNLLHE